MAQPEAPTPLNMTTPRRQTRTSARAVLAAAAIALAAQSAAAQLGVIPSATVQSTSMSASDRASIESFVAAQRDNLLTTDWARFRQARDTALSPLEDSRASVAFRQAYTEALRPILDELTTPIEGNETATRWRRIAAVRIAGALASQRSIAIVESALTDAADADARVFAAATLEQAFRSLRNSTAAVNQGTAGRIEQHLATMIAQDPEPLAADAALRALAAAATVPQDTVPNLASDARRDIADATAQRLRGRMLWLAEGDTATAERDLVLRAAGVLTELVLRSSTSDQDAIKSAVLLGATMYAAAARDVDERTDRQPFTETDNAVLFATAAESLVGLGSQKLQQPGAQVEPDAGIIDALTGDLTDARLLLAEITGSVTRAPYNADPQDLDLSEPNG